MTQYIVSFNGANATSGQQVISGIPQILAGDRVASIVGVSGQIGDMSNFFDAISPSSGVLVQNGGGNLSTVVLVALMNRASV